jgi:hypothetical protein
VFGPARAGTLKDWWEADQIGKPLTPLMREWLVRGSTHKMPKIVQKALARRGLLLPPDWNNPKASRWTAEAERLREELGES